METRREDASAAAMRKYKYARPVLKITTAEQMAEAILSVSARAAAWAQLDLNQKITMLKCIKSRMIKCSIQLGRGNAVVTGHGPLDCSSAAFEAQANSDGMMQSATMATWLDGHIRALQQRRDGTTPDAAALTRRDTADGRAVLQVTGPDRPPLSLFLRSSQGYVYLKPGQQPSQGVEAREARKLAAKGACFVLGAGNQAFLCVCDTLHVMFHDGHVVCLKYHDAQAETAPFLEYILEPLSEPGFLRGFHCDLPSTSDALHHSSVCRVHLTGSARTHDAIAWGTGEDAERRAEAGEPLLGAPMTSELGNVTPNVVVPGEWAAQDLRLAAQLIALNMTNNAGFNCLATKAIVLSAEWPQAAEFEAALKAEVKASPATLLWYPGATDLYARFMEDHPGCKLVAPTATPDGECAKPSVPWAFHSVTVSSAADAAAVPGLAAEYFAPVVTIIRLAADAVSDGTTPRGASIPGSLGSTQSASSAAGTCPAATAAFLRALPDFLEDGLWGNLVMSIYAPTAVEESAEAELQACVDELRYGSVVVNAPAFLAYGHIEGAWGGFQAAGTSMRNPGSGVGHVGNMLCLDGVEKQVVRMELGWAPTGKLALPRFVMKGMVGLLCGGLTGLWQAATA